MKSDDDLSWEQLQIRVIELKRERERERDSEVNRKWQSRRCLHLHLHLLLPPQRMHKTYYALFGLHIPLHLQISRFVASISLFPFSFLHNSLLFPNLIFSLNSFRSSISMFPSLFSPLSFRFFPQFRLDLDLYVIKYLTFWLCSYL